MIDLFGSSVSLSSCPHIWSLEMYLVVLWLLIVGLFTMKAGPRHVCGALGKRYRTPQFRLTNKQTMPLWPDRDINPSEDEEDRKGQETANPDVQTS